MAGVSLGAMGPLGGPDGQAGRVDRGGGQWISDRARHRRCRRALTVFQRTPQWMAPNPRYHAAVKTGERWAMRHLPGYARCFRFMLMWQSSDKLLELVRTDPDWHDFPRTANAASAARARPSSAGSNEQVGDDPELLPEGDSGLSADGKADVAGRRELVALPEAAARRSGHRPDRRHRPRWCRHRERPLRSRRHRAGHRIPGQRGAVADGDRRPRRSVDRRNLGR